MANKSDDDDIPQLSVETLAALQEFYNENEQMNGKTIEENWVRHEDKICNVEFY